MKRDPRQNEQRLQPSSYKSSPKETWYIHERKNKPSQGKPGSLQGRNRPSQGNSKGLECKFTPVSVSLMIEKKIVLNKDNGYVVRFNSGIQEGTGISINDTGSLITFHSPGSYQLDMCGDAVLFSDVDIALVYHSNMFTSDIEPFSKTKVPKFDGKLQLRGIPVIVPVKENQTITVKLIPTPDESITVQEGTRLLIHRVA